LAVDGRVLYVNDRNRVISCRFLEGPFRFHSKQRVSLGEHGVKKGLDFYPTVTIQLLLHIY